MLINLCHGFVLMMVGLFLQSGAVVLAQRFYRKRLHAAERLQLHTTLLIMNGVMLLLVAGIMLQVAVWASFYLYLGEFKDFATALYHSGVNFSTLGYGDFVMSEQHRLLGPLQAINGVLMVGLSTAALITASQDVSRRQRRTATAGQADTDER